MVLAASVLIEVVAIGIILRTFDTIKVAETREVFNSLAFLVLGEMSRRLQVGFDLIEITSFVSEKIGRSWSNVPGAALGLAASYTTHVETVGSLLSSEYRAACFINLLFVETKIGLVFPWPE